MNSSVVERVDNAMSACPRCRKLAPEQREHSHHATIRLPQGCRRLPLRRLARTAHPTMPVSLGPIGPEPVNRQVPTTPKTALHRITSIRTDCRRFSAGGDQGMAAGPAVDGGGGGVPWGVEGTRGCWGESPRV